MTLDLFFSRAGHLIRRMNQISVAMFLEETRSLGLTTVQYAALNMIDEVPNIDQARLSSMIAFDTTTLSRIFTAKFQTAATMTIAIKPVRIRMTACSNFS